MLVYLCSAIDHGSGNGSWKRRLQEFLLAESQELDKVPPVLFDPGAAWLLTGRPVSQADASTVVAIDMATVKMSDALVLYYQPGVESWGMPQELMLAHLEEIPVLVWWEADISPDAAWDKIQQSLVLSSQLSPQLVFTTLEGLADGLRACPIREDK